MIKLLLLEAYMIDIKCQTKHGITLDELTPFQGDLKKRTDKDVALLAKSIADEGLLMPFAVWKHEGVNSLLDGHGRYAALKKMSIEDGSILEQALPVIYIEAESEEQAKKSLLQITSSYGRITRSGAVNFCKSLPEYHAPAINRFVYKRNAVKKFDKPRTEQQIRISVPLDKAEAVLELFKTVSYIRVL